MKIVARKEFLELPEGTVYSRYKPHVIEELFIKGDAFFAENNDFSAVSLIGNIECNSTGEYFEILESNKEFRYEYECGCRDGMFDESQQFVIYDKEDVRALISALEGTLK